METMEFREGEQSANADIHRPNGEAMEHVKRRIYT